MPKIANDMKVFLGIVCAYAIIITILFARERFGISHLRAAKPNTSRVEPGGGDFQKALDSALVEVRAQNLMRSNFSMLKASRSTDRWVFSLDFDPQLVGGDVIAVVHDDGRVVTGPGL